jgi:hypothetical protein
VPASLPAVCNRYLRALPQTGFPPEHDDAAAVVRPLFLTGWLIADSLARAAWHDADVVVRTSASSRTACCTASAIREHDDPSARLIGAAWSTFADAQVPEPIEIRHATGADVLAQAYASFAEGDVDPREEWVFTLQAAAGSRRQPVVGRRASSA